MVESNHQLMIPRTLQQQNTVDLDFGQQRSAIEKLMISSIFHKFAITRLTVQFLKSHSFCCVANVKLSLYVRTQRSILYRFLNYDTWYRRKL